MMAVDVFTAFELTEVHVSVIVGLMGTFGLGGVYIKGFKTAFAKFQKTKEITDPLIENITREIIKKAKDDALKTKTD